MPTMTQTGGCHCGAVRFEAEIDLSKPVSRCNCTMCSKIHASNIIVKPSEFKLLQGQESLTDYQRGSNPTHHPFCKVCGVHVFGYGNIPDVGGDYVGINALTLDDIDVLRDASFIYWDGRHNNWQAGPRGEPWPARPPS